MNISKDRHMWTTEKHRYALLKEDEDSYIIYDKKYKVALIIEDDIESRMIINEIIINGNEIIEDL